MVLMGQAWTGPGQNAAGELLQFVCDARFAAAPNFLGPALCFGVEDVVFKFCFRRDTIVMVITDG
jgi:hypothetical protein